MQQQQDTGGGLHFWMQGLLTSRIQTASVRQTVDAWSTTSSSSGLRFFLACMHALGRQDLHGVQCTACMQSVPPEFVPASLKSCSRRPLAGLGGWLRPRLPASIDLPPACSCRAPPAGLLPAGFRSASGGLGSPLALRRTLLPPPGATGTARVTAGAQNQTIDCLGRIEFLCGATAPAFRARRRQRQSGCVSAAHGTGTRQPGYIINHHYPRRSRGP
jgi:hypothetical protein